jgi:hypothetical protein
LNFYEEKAKKDKENIWNSDLLINL